MNEQKSVKVTPVLQVVWYKLAIDSFQCEVYGSPTPDITWYKNAVPIDGESPKYDISNEGQDLLIRLVNGYLPTEVLIPN